MNTPTVLKDQITYVKLPDGGFKFYPMDALLIGEFFDAHKERLKEKQGNSSDDENFCGAV